MWHSVRCILEFVLNALHSLELLQYSELFHKLRYDVNGVIFHVALGLRVVSGQSIFASAKLRELSKG